MKFYRVKLSVVLLVGLPDKNVVFGQTHSRAFEEASGRFGRGNFNVYFVVSPFL